MVPRPWQREALRHIFARRPDGRRRHRLAIYATGRKNGKTNLPGSGVALYGLTMEGEGAQVISCAADRDQAKLVFGAAKRMVELDPDLSDEIRPYRDVLEHRTTGSVYRAVSSEAYTKEGLSPTIVIGDELHAWPTRELFDVMQLAMGTRVDPLFLIPTTAGVMSNRKEEETILYRLFQYALAIIRGEVDDPTFFMAWWGALDTDDHRDESAWPAANPGLGDILDLEEMRSAVHRTPEAEFRTKRLNMFTEVGEYWLPSGAWEACRSDLELDPKRPIAVGIDIGLRHDSTAVVIAQPHGERIVVRAGFWANPHPPGTAAHEDWRLDKAVVLAHIRELRKAYPVAMTKIDGRTYDGPAFCYDPWGFEDEAATLLRDERMAMIEVRQTAERMGPAARTLYEAIVTGRIAHDGDPILAAHLRHVVAIQLGEHGWRLRKPEGSARKIDGAIALAMAVDQAVIAPPRAFHGLLA